jgi:hypothetical protein
MSADGPEARTADFEEHYERDLDALDISEKLADESRDALTINTADELVAKLVELVTAPNCDNETKATSIRIAFEMGCAEGRVQGAKTMGDHLCNTLKTS